MKRMWIKRLISVVVVAGILLFIPIVVFAGPVTWSSEQFQADAWMSWPTGSPTQTVSGTSLPMSVGTCSLFQMGACSSITATQMYTYAFANMTDQGAEARSSFRGTYTALEDKPLFQFIYSLAYSHTSDSPYSYAWLTVKDNTDNNNVLYSNNLLPISSDLITISINTTPGHTISVDFGTRSETDTWIEGGLRPHSAYGDQSLTLNYSTATAVAPEPISSILFVTGGTLLAGRRFLRRKA